jgi:hypothetical protein
MLSNRKSVRLRISLSGPVAELRVMLAYADGYVIREPITVHGYRFTFYVKRGRRRQRCFDVCNA